MITMKRKTPKLIRILLVAYLVFLPFAMNFNPVRADALTSVSALLENSGSGDASDYTISFTTPTGIPADDSTITISFPAGFTISSIDETEVDLAYSGGDHTDAIDCAQGGNEEMGVSISSQDLVLQICNGDGGGISAAGSVVIEIGVLSSEAGTDQITNHATESEYAISIDVDSSADTGDAMIAIIDDITASVTVDEVLSFAVAGQSAAQCQDVANSDAEIANSTATTVPFATPTVENFIDTCQELTITTNATNGYSVTIAEDDQLTSPESEVIADGTCDSGCDDSTAAVWAVNTNNGFGYCLIDVTGGDKSTDFDTYPCDNGTPYFKTIPSDGDSDTPEVVMTNTGAVSGSVIDVGYRISISGIQEPGAYTNEIWYVATPTY